MKYFLFLLLVVLFSCSNYNEQKLSVIRSGDGIKFDLSTAIDSISLITLSPDTLRILRNEIFARYGYVFESKDLNNYFSQFEWYESRNNNSVIIKNLSRIDEANIKLIKEIESKKNVVWDKGFVEFLSYLPQFEFPLHFRCSRLVGYKEVEIPDLIAEKYLEKFSFVYGILYRTYNEVAVIHGFVGDFLYFEIYKYNQKGEVVNKISLLPSGCCGDDAGVSVTTSGVIDKDFYIKSRTVVETWDYEIKNSKIDSTVSEAVRSLRKLL